MHTRWLVLPVLVAVLPTAAAVPQLPAADRAVAVTFDDLPATPAGVVANDVASLAEVTRKLLKAVRQYGVLRGLSRPARHTVAPVTIDNDEFVYAAEYAKALRRGDSAAAARIADDYLRYIEEVFSFFEDVSRRVIGREIIPSISALVCVRDRAWFRLDLQSRRPAESGRLGPRRLEPEAGAPRIAGSRW